MKTLEKAITNPVGLHARPAALFVQTAMKFKAKITITHNGKTANAKSLLGLLGLGVTQGAQVCIGADGEDEEAAIHSLDTLINSNFGE